MFPLKQRPATRSGAGRDDLDVDRPVRTASVRVVPSAVDDGPTRAFVDGGSTSTLQELLLAVASGDQEALAALERHIGGLVRVNIRRVVRDALQSGSVTQEFFAEVPREATHFDPARESAQSWLLTRAHLRAMSGLTTVDTPSRRTDRPLHVVAGSVDDLAHSGEPAA